jgi:proteasome accessory factor B
MDDDRREGGKRDRLARFYRVLRALESRGDEGATPEEVARIVGVSRRTVYRDLHALEDELGVPVWSEAGRWGVDRRGFLPPLKLTRAEAMAVFLSARLMARYADDYDPDLGAAFQKLAEALPPVLGEHVERTVALMATRPIDERSNRHVHLLTRAWAERRIVEFTYDPGAYDPARPPRHARVHPYLIEPSFGTRALYLIGYDEARGAIRTFKIERVRDLALTPDTFEPEPGQEVEETFRRAWDMIADQPEVEVVVRFAPNVAARVLETTWHPSQTVAREPDGSLIWRARLSGTIEVRLWILSWGADVEVLEPAALREDVAATHRRAASRYGGDGGGARP